MPRGKREFAGRNKPPGIREIAKNLGISIGTVDRTLHNRPGINEWPATDAGATLGLILNVVGGIAQVHCEHVHRPAGEIVGPGRSRQLRGDGGHRYL